jgi:hypothetical protein
VTGHDHEHVDALVPHGCSPAQDEGSGVQAPYVEAEVKTTTMDVAASRIHEGTSSTVPGIPFSTKVGPHV